MGNRVGFGARLGALLLDGIAIFIGAIVLGIALGGVIGNLLGTGAGAAAATQGGATGADAQASAAAGGLLGTILGALAGIVVMGPLLSLVWILWEGLTGQALGKLMLGIKIKNADGNPGNVGQLLARAAVKYSSTLLAILAVFTHMKILDTVGSVAGVVIFIGCFFALGGAKQALHDMIVGTAVYPSRAS